MRPGDEVITTPFTFFATAGTIHNVGATPVFVDIDPSTFNILPDAAAAARTSQDEGRACRSICSVRWRRSSTVMTALPGIPVIEDAAQTIGARRSIDGEWRMAGEVATIGTFSFFPSKNLGGYGDGGMMVTQDEALATRLKRLRMHGGAKMYFHDEVGFNSRLDALQAAVLQRQAAAPRSMEREAPRRTRRTTIAAFADVAGVRTPFVDPANESIFNQYTIRADRRDAAAGVSQGARASATAIYYPLPLHLQPCFAYLGYKAGSCPESERAAS